jgi:hypothetical protein
MTNKKHTALLPQILKRAINKEVLITKKQRFTFIQKLR